MGDNTNIHINYKGTEIEIDDERLVEKYKDTKFSIESNRSITKEEAKLFLELWDESPSLIPHEEKIIGKGKREVTLYPLF